MSLVTGYDAARQVFKLRNSWGDTYGKLGNSEISFADAFAKDVTQALVCPDGGNRRAPKQKAVVSNPLSIRIALDVALLGKLKC